MVMMASQHVPDRVIRQQLASAINVVVHCARLSDGTRKVTGISEVVGVEHDQVEMQDIFEFERTGVSPRGRVVGRFRASGARPICLERLKSYGIHLSSSIFEEQHEVKEK
jgi:pilus assembly protein CpaF